jgi:DNA replication protein DnaC
MTQLSELTANAMRAFEDRERLHSSRMANDAAYRNAIEAGERLERKRRWESDIRRLGAAGLPERLVPAILSSSYEQTGCVGRVVEFVSSEQFVLILGGAPGCGKTFAAAFGAAQASANCHRHGETSEGMPHVRFRHVRDLARLEKYGRFADEDLKPLEQTCMLVLDDLGVENLNDALRSAIDGIVDARYANGRRTIITTNLTPPDFRQRYGERIYDRLREVGSYFTSTDASRRGAR